MDYAYLAVFIDQTQGNFTRGHLYYYKLPVYPDSPDTALTEQRAREIFLLDANRHLKLLAELPVDGCIAFVKIGDLRFPIPNPRSSIVSVLRVNHILRVGENFEILAELKDWKLTDKAFVEILGSAAYSGRYQMTAQNTQLPDGSTFSWRKQFSALPAGAEIEYRVYANDQTDYKNGTIRVDNTDTAHGPVWGNWLPKIVQIGEDYGDSLPEDAAIGTGVINYFLLDAPAWFNFSQNTRQIFGLPPGTEPATPQKVTFRAIDSNGQSDKTFTLEFASALDMVAGWGFENVPGGSKLYFGIGPNDELPYTVKLTQRIGSNFTDTSVHTAERVGISLVSVSYPWRAIYDNVPIGTYQAEITRSNGQKRYAQFVFSGQQGGWPLTLSASAPTNPTNPTNPTSPASLDGDDIWTNTGSNDGSLNDNVAPVERTLKSLDADGPNQCPEGESVQLRCLATYTDDSVVNVTTLASGGVTGGGVSLSGGVLTALANATTGDTHNVTASFSYGGKTATKVVQIVDRSAVPVTLVGIAWRFPTAGPFAVDEGTDTQLRVIATYSDDSTGDITATAAKGGGVTGADILQNGIFRVASNTVVGDGRTVRLSATYNGKVDFITITIKDTSAPAPSIVIQLVDVDVRNNGKLFHYVKTVPVSRTQGAAPVQQIYYRIKASVGGGLLPTTYPAWDASNLLFDHTDAGLGDLQNVTLKNQGFNHYLYGAYFGTTYAQHTITIQLSLSPTGANAIECSYTVPASANQPTVSPKQIYPTTT